MPTLDDVAGRLQAARQKGSMILSGETLEAEEVDDLLAALGETELKLDDPQLEQAADKVTVAGRASVAGLPMDATWTFTVQTGALSVALHAELNELTLKLPALSWASVQKLTLDVTVAGPSLAVPIVSGALTGEVALAGLAKPIEVTLRPMIGEGGWLLSAQHIELPDPIAILQGLLPGQEGHALMPSALGSVDGLEIIELACGFDPDTLSVQSILVAVGAPGKTWTFTRDLPQLPALSDVTLSLLLAFPDADAGEGAPDFSAVAAAHILIPLAAAAGEAGDRRDLDLPVQVIGSSDEWRFGIVGAHGFPSLGELVKTVTDPSTAEMLPTALTTLKMDSASIEVALAAADGALRSVSFSTTLADKWELVEGHLWLDGVALQARADGADTSGYVTGTIEIDDFALPVAVNLPPNKAPWSLRLGSSASHDLKGVGSLAGMSQGDDVSKDLPDIGKAPVTLTDLAVTVDPVTRCVQSANIRLDSTGPWVLDAASGADVRDLTVALGVVEPADPAKRQFTGKIVGTLDVNGVTLKLAASKDPPAPAIWHLLATLTVHKIDITAELTERASGGWDFKAGTGKDEQIPLGELVKDLAAQLGKFEVPAPLAGATLSNLDVEFDTGGTKFTFSGHAKVPMDESDRPLELDLAIAVSRTAGGTSTTATFEVEIDGLIFELAVIEGATVTRLVATYTHAKMLPPPASVSLGSLVKAVDPSAADIPDISVDLKAVVLATASGDGPARVLFALDVGAIELSKLPIVGSLISGAVVDDLKVVALTAAPGAGDLDAWNSVLPDTAKLPATGLDEGVAVSAVLRLAEASTPLALPASTSTTIPVKSNSGAPPEPATKWFVVQRSFGPFTLDRVGGRYDAGMLWVLLDASMTLGGLSVSLTGLGVGSPLDGFDPHFHLDGLGLAFREDPIEISGSFLVVPPKGDVQFQYDGAAVVRAESFALAAVGSYAQLKDGESSLFIFVELDAPLGGPPALYVTGLMGGFGYNRALRIPNQDEVFKFPFVAGLEAAGTGKGGPAGMLTTLEQDPNPWLTVKEGENWVAVGITFTSFEVVESKALLIAEFGKDIQFALIGLSKMQLPTEGDEVFAYLELEIEAILKPNEGFFGLTAQVSPNSFVIDRKCRLTGGFAFYLWFDGEHKGDFVLTLGGYHPAFTPPAHYPKEPRLGLSWPVNDLVSIDGSAYFALTPSCVMGGGGMHVLFHDGNLRAWLTASADFLISWEPFQYSAGIGVSVGVSYYLGGAIQKTLSVELAAQLSLWGPPTGGTAHISWYIISFTVSFGADPPKPPTEKPDWRTLTPLLPDELCTVTLQSGLLPSKAGLDGDRPADAKPDDNVWLVRADSLKLATESAVPASNVCLGAAEFDKSAKAPAIRPLGLSEFGSTHTLRLTSPLGHEIDLKGDGWTVEARKRSMPSSLWGAPLGDNDSPLEGDSLIDDQLVGFTVSPPGPKEGAKLTGTIESVTHPSGSDGTLPPADTPAGPTPSVDPKDALAAVAGIAADGAKGRAAVRAALKARQLDPGTDDALDAFAKQVTFPVPPMLLRTT